MHTAHVHYQMNFSQKRKRKISTVIDRNLDPEFLSNRAGHGSAKVTYLEGWNAINLANGIFGFDGWSSKIKSLTEEYCEKTNGSYSVGYSCQCRVTLKNGAYREDVGFGNAENQKQKGAGVEKAKKEAATDALKRALRLFGNALGNCCYNKEYINSIQRHIGNKKKKGTKKTLKESDLKEESTISFELDNEVSDLSPLN